MTSGHSSHRFCCVGVFLLFFLNRSNRMTHIIIKHDICLVRGTSVPHMLSHFISNFWFSLATQFCHKCTLESSLMTLQYRLRWPADLMEHLSERTRVPNLAALACCMLAKVDPSMSTSLHYCMCDLDEVRTLWLYACIRSPGNPEPECTEIGDFISKAERYCTGKTHQVPRYECICRAYISVSTGLYINNVYI